MEDKDLLKDIMKFFQVETEEELDGTGISLTAAGRKFDFDDKGNVAKVTNTEEAK